MKKFPLVAFFAVLFLTFASFSFAAEYKNNKTFLIGGKSVKQSQESFLRNLRLLEQKQELALLQAANSDLRREAMPIEAQAGRGGKPGGSTPPPPGTSYPNDPYYWSNGTWGQSYADLWGIKKIGGDVSVWDLYKGENVTIGIVDTGLLYNHQDIASNVWINVNEIAGNGIDDDGDGYVDDVRGWDFVDFDNDPFDLNGHGSHVAGIAAAIGDNSTGIVGVAPLAKIIPVRVLDRTGSGSLQAVADGIRYAATVGADIINLSLGAANLTSTSLALLQDAVDYAVELGSIIVAAAGNSNADVDDFSPANLSGVIAVGATDPFDQKASFSNYGSSLFISAPGVDILSLGAKRTSIGTAVTSNYYRASGTSMAAPFVSGAIALLLDKYPTASLNDIRNLLAAGAADLGATGWDPYFGYGRLDIGASLSLNLTDFTSSSADLFNISSSQQTSFAFFTAPSTGVGIFGYDFRMAKRRFEDDFLQIA